MIMTVFAGIAKFERDLMQERTAAGRIVAQKRGGRCRCPRKLHAHQEKLARRLVSEEKGVPEVARTFHVLLSTLYRLSTLDAEAGVLFHGSPIPINGGVSDLDLHG